MLAPKDDGGGSVGGGLNNTAPTFSVQLSFKASGSVEDYDDTLKASLLKVFAVAAGIADEEGNAPKGSVLTVTAASVLIVATFPVASKALATSAEDKLKVTLTSPDAVNDLFAEQGITGITCLEAPIIETVSGGGSGSGLTLAPAAGGGGAMLFVGFGLFGALLGANLIYVLWKYRARLLGAGGKDAGKAAAAEAGAAGEDEDAGKGDKPGAPDEEDDPVLEYLDLGFTKGLDDSDTLAVNPVMAFKMNGAKKRQRAAAAAAQLGLTPEEAAARTAEQGSASVGSGRPGGLARLGFKLTKGKGAEKEVNHGMEVKGIEMFLAREEDIDIKHTEVRKATAAGSKGGGLIDVATSSEHLSNLGRIGGRRGSAIAMTADAARKHLKHLKETKGDVFPGSSSGGADDSAYRESQIRRASQIV